MSPSRILKPLLAAHLMAVCLVLVPLAAVADAYSAYVSDRYHSPGNIARFDTQTNAITSWFGVGSDASDMAVSPDGRYLYVVNSDTVWAVSTLTDEVVASAHVTDAHAVTVSADGRRIWVAATPYVYVMTAGDPADSLEVSGLIYMDGGLVNDIEFSPDGETAYVSVVKDLGSGDFVAAIDTDYYWSSYRRWRPMEIPGELAVAADGETLYVASVATEDVAAVDTATGTSSETFEVLDDGILRDVVADPSESWLYVLANTHETGELFKVEKGTRHYVSKALDVGYGPTEMALDPSGDRLYVVNRDEASVSAVDLDGWRVAATIRGFEEPFFIAVAPPYKPVLEIDPRDLTEHLRETWRLLIERGFPLEPGHSRIYR